MCVTIGIVYNYALTQIKKIAHIFGSISEYVIQNFLANKSPLYNRLQQKVLTLNNTVISFICTVS